MKINKLILIAAAFLLACTPAGSSSDPADTGNLVSFECYYSTADRSADESPAGSAVFSCSLKKTKDGAEGTVYRSGNDFYGDYEQSFTADVSALEQLQQLISRRKIDEIRGTGEDAGEFGFSLKMSYDSGKKVTVSSSENLLYDTQMTALKEFFEELAGITQDDAGDAGYAEDSLTVEDIRNETRHDMHLDPDCFRNLHIGKTEEGDAFVMHFENDENIACVFVISVPGQMPAAYQEVKADEIIEDDPYTYYMNDDGSGEVRWGDYSHYILQMSENASYETLSRMRYYMQITWENDE